MMASLSLSLSGGVMYVPARGAGQLHATQGWLRGRVAEEREGGLGRGEKEGGEERKRGRWLNRSCNEA